MNSILNLRSFIMESADTNRFLESLHVKNGTDSAFTDALSFLEGFNKEVTDLTKGMVISVSEAEDTNAETLAYTNYFQRFGDVISTFNRKIRGIADASIINIENLIDAHKDAIEDTAVINFVPFGMTIQAFDNIEDTKLPEFTAKKHYVKDFDSIGKQMQALGNTATNASKLGIIAAVYNDLAAEMSGDFLKKCTEKLIGDSYDETKSYAEQLYRIFRVGSTEREISQADYLTAKAALANYTLYTGVLSSTAEKLISDFSSIADSIRYMLYQNRASAVVINTDTDGVANAEYKLSPYALGQLNLFMTKKAEQLVQIVNMYTVAFSVKADAILSYMSQCKDIVEKSVEQSNPTIATPTCDTEPSDDAANVAPSGEIEVDPAEEPNINPDDPEEAETVGEESDDDEDDDDYEDDDYEDDFGSDDDEEEPEDDEDEEPDEDEPEEGAVSENMLIDSVVNLPKNIKRVRATRIKVRQTLAESCRKGSYPGYLEMINSLTDIDTLEYVRTDARVGIQQMTTMAERVKIVQKKGQCEETKHYYKGIKKQIDEGVTYDGLMRYIKWNKEVVIPRIGERIRELRKASTGGKKTYKEWLMDTRSDDILIDEMSAFFEYESFQLSHLAYQEVMREELIAMLEEDQPATASPMSNLNKMANDNSTKGADAWQWIMNKFLELWKKFKDLFITKQSARIKQLKQHEREITANKFADDATLVRYDIDTLMKVKVPDLNYDTMKPDLKDADTFANKYIFGPSGISVNSNEGTSGVSATLKKVVIPQQEEKGIDDALKGKIYDFCVNKMQSFVNEAERQKNIVSKASNNASRMAKSIYNATQAANNAPTDTKPDTGAGAVKPNGEAFDPTGFESVLMEFDKGTGTKSIKNDLTVYFRACTAVLSTQTSVANKAFNEFYRALASLFNGKDPSGQNGGNNQPQGNQ